MASIPNLLISAAVLAELQREKHKSVPQAAVPVLAPVIAAPAPVSVPAPVQSVEVAVAPVPAPMAVTKPASLVVSAGSSLPSVSPSPSPASSVSTSFTFTTLPSPLRKAISKAIEPSAAASIAPVPAPVSAPVPVSKSAPKASAAPAPVVSSGHSILNESVDNEEFDASSSQMDSHNPKRLNDPSHISSLKSEVKALTRELNACEADLERERERANKAETQLKALMKTKENTAYENSTKEWAIGSLENELNAEIIKTNKLTAQLQFEKEEKELLESQMRMLRAEKEVWEGQREEAMEKFEELFSALETQAEELERERADHAATQQALEDAKAESEWRESKFKALVGSLRAELKAIKDSKVHLAEEHAVATAKLGQELLAQATAVQQQTTNSLSGLLSRVGETINAAQQKNKKADGKSDADLEADREEKRKRKELEMAEKARKQAEEEREMLRKQLDEERKRNEKREREMEEKKTTNKKKKIAEDKEKDATPVKAKRGKRAKNSPAALEKTINLPDLTLSPIALHVEDHSNSNSYEEKKDTSVAPQEEASKKRKLFNMRKETDNEVNKENQAENVNASNQNTSISLNGSFLNRSNLVKPFSVGLSAQSAGFPSKGFTLNAPTSVGLPSARPISTGAPLKPLSVNPMLNPSVSKLATSLPQKSSFLQFLQGGIKAPKLKGAN